MGLHTDQLVETHGQLPPGNIDHQLGRYIEGFDMGAFIFNATSILDVVIDQVGVDMGSFTAPASTSVDLGSI